MLIKIFKLCLQDTSQFFRSERLTDLYQVCTNWSHLVTHTPSLWDSISYQDCTEMRRMLLSMSKGSPLNIGCRSNRVMDPTGAGPAFVAFVSDVYAHVGRWRSAAFCVSVTQSKILRKAFSRLSAPLLEELQLEFGDGDLQTTALKDVIRWNLPRLRHLKLAHVDIPWNCRLLLGLHTLEIDLLGTPGPSLSQVIAILKACPDLEKLNLSYLDCLIDAGAARRHSRMISLPRLKKLELFLPPALLHDILSVLQIQSCTSLAVHASTWGQKGTGVHLLEDIDNIAPVVLRCLESAQRLVLDLARGFQKMSFTAQNDGNGGRCETPPSVVCHIEEPKLASLQWLLETIPFGPSLPALELKISSATIDLDEEHMERTLTSLSRHVKTLYLFSEGLPPSLLKLLSQPRDVDGVEQWLFPDLQELRIGVLAGLAPHKALQILRGRRTANQASPGSYQMPVRLAKLNLPRDCSFSGPFTQEDKVAMQSLVDVVVWSENLT